MRPGRSYVSTECQCNNRSENILNNLIKNTFCWILAWTNLVILKNVWQLYPLYQTHDKKIFLGYKFRLKYFSTNVRGIPIAENLITDFWALKLSSKVRDTRGLFAVHVSPRKSANNPVADFRGHSRNSGITDNLQLHNKYFPDFRGFAFNPIFTSLRKSAAGLIADFCGLSRIYVNSKNSSRV